jgi:hypothetical protein
MKARVVLLVVLSVVLATTHVGSQQPRTLGWDPSPSADDVIEYHVFRGPATGTQIYIGATSAPGDTFPFTIAPGETAIFSVASFGWLRDAAGARTGETGVGPWSASFTYREPATPSPDGTTIPPAAAIADCNGATFTVSGRVVYRNGADTGGRVDLLLLHQCGIFGYVTSDASWWAYSGSAWSRIAGDPQPQAPPETCAPDGTGNGVDEDRDGQTDEGCLPPQPTPQGCRLMGSLLNGQPYPIGYRFQALMAQKQVDAFAAARSAEGWFEWRKRQKDRNQVTLFMECRGL